MKSNLKRLLSMALVLVMVLSLVPATVFAAEGDSAADAAQNVATGAQYADLSQAISEAQPGQIVKALADAQDVVYDNQGVILDLNGYDLSVTVSEGVTVSAIDSATDDYEGEYGTLTTDGKVATTVKTGGEVKSYVTIAEDGSYSFHRYYAAIAAISLKPTQVALGYRAEFRGDEAVKNAVINYGYELWVNNGAHKTYTRTDALTKSSLTLRLQNIMAEGNEALNAIGSTATIGGNAFVTLELNGEQVKLSGTEKQTTLRQVVESVNANVSSYGEAQLESVRAMITTYAAWMEGWNTAAIFGGNQGEGTEGDLKVEIVVDVVAQGNVLSQDATMSHGGISATVPAGAILEEGATQLVLTITEKTSSDSDVTQGEGESLIPLDVHIAGISADNTTPIIICLGEVLPKALNIGNYDLFHVEDGKTVPMTHVSIDELDAHNEFSYDPATGSVTVAVASFSEITMKSNDANVWNGQTQNFKGSGTKDDPYIIANADQLAYMSQMVSINEGYASAHYKLISDLNFGGYSNTVDENDVPTNVFYPIGYWKQQDGVNAAGEVYYGFGNAFRGVFDGNGNTIANLCQRTWDMNGNYDNGYWDDAMGLFGATYDATIKNLTIDNFQSDGEFTPTGCVAAYAGGASTFENITLTNCNPRVYNTANGGIVGLNYNSTTADKVDTLIFRNITVDQTNKITALWGSWDVGCGGILGRLRDDETNTNELNTATFENCHVSAIIDVYNDVCANYQYYQYRYCGMLIGTVDYVDLANFDVKNVVKASNTYVTYGDWNEYWYCELVANSLASYTHDHQFSRLEKITSIADISNDEGKTWTKAGNFVIPATNETDAVCYHIVNKDGVLTQHKHEDAGKETINGVEMLKEDRQHYYIPFGQLFTGYGWGSSMRDTFDGVTVNGSDTVKSTAKFTAKNVDTLLTGEVAIGDLFELAVSEGKLSASTLQVFVSPADENSTVSGSFSGNNTTWSEGKLTITGTGKAKITITDYFYCTNTTLVVDVVTPVVRFHAYDNVLTTATSNTVNLVKPTTCPDGYEFKGWSETYFAGETKEAPEIITGETYTPTEATTNLYAVYYRTETTEGTLGVTNYTLVTDASSLKAGDNVIIVNTTKKTVAGDLNAGLMKKVDVIISDKTITTLPSGAVVLTLGGSTGAWTFTNESGKLLGATAVKKVAWGSGTTTWSISIDASGNATIQNSTTSYGRFLYNSNSGSERFTTYTSNTSASMLLPQLYRETTTQGIPGETSTYYVTYEVTCQHTDTTTTTVDATCKNTGSITVTCNDCGDVISTQTIPVIDHNYVDGTCSMCGQAVPVEPTESYFTKVTTAPADWSGTYLIVYEDGNVAFNGGLETLDGTSNTIAVTIENNKILANDTTNAAVFTIAKADGGYSIQSASGYYIGQTATDNGLKSDKTTPYANTLALDSSGNALIKIANTTLKYNKTSNQNRFRYYKSGQQAIALYKLDTNQQIANGVTVTYFENGVENAVTVEKGTAIELPTPTNIPIGYTFVGWTDGEVEYTTTEQEITPAGESFTVNSNLEFHALYSRIDIISGDATPVTDVSTLAVGDQVIICATHSRKTYALSTKQNNNNRSAMEVTAGKLETGIQLLTLQEGAVENTFAFYTGTGYLYAASSSSNHLKTDDKLTENGSWEITASSAIAQGDYTHNVMQFNANTNNGTPIFSCYAEDKTEDAFADIVFYKTSDVVTATYYTTLAQ